MSTSTNKDASAKSGDFKPNWAASDGSFKRQVSSFRDVIEKGGKFEPEKGMCDVPSIAITGRQDSSRVSTGRYHLYVCNAW